MSLCDPVERLHKMVLRCFTLFAHFFPQMYITLVCKTKGTRLATPTLSLAVISLAVMVGVVRVSEYRNHWSDILAGFITGGAIAMFLVRKQLS